MKSAVFLSVAVGLCLTAGARTDDKIDPLRGEWKLLSTQDVKRTEPGCEQSRMTVRGDGRVTFMMAGRTMNSGTLEVGTCGQLKSLDLKLAEGKTLLGVYQWKEGELVICFAEAGQARPAGTAPKGTQWAETWQRVEPGKRAADRSR